MAAFVSSFVFILYLVKHDLTKVNLFLGFLATLGFGGFDAYLSVLLQGFGGTVWLGALLQCIVSGGQELVTLFLCVTQLEAFKITQ